MISINELKKTIALAVPIVLGQMGQVGFGIMDNAMVGRLGKVELAAAGFANMVTALPLVFLIGVTSAISVMVAQAFGSNRDEDTGPYMLAGMFLVIVIFLFMLSFYLLGPDFLPWFDQPDEVLEAVRPYFGFIVWSMFPMVIFQGLRQFSVGLEKAMWPTAILFTALGLNYILNYALIYGNWGAPELGLVGAGWGTLIGRIWMVVALFILIYKSAEFEKYRPKALAFTKRHLRPVSKMGLTSGIQYLFEVGAFVAAGLMSGWIGTTELAAHNVAINVGSFTFMFAWGICFATGVRVGQAHGQFNTELARARGLAGTFLVGAVMTVFGIVIISVRNFIPEFYIDDQAVIKVASTLLVICAVFQIVDGLQAVFIGALRGISDVVFPSISTAIIYWGITIPCSYVLAFKYDMGVEGLWWGLTLGLTLASIVMGWRFLYKTR